MAHWISFGLDFLLASLEEYMNLRVVRWAHWIHSIPKIKSVFEKVSVAHTNSNLSTVGLTY